MTSVRGKPSAGDLGEAEPGESRQGVVQSAEVAGEEGAKEVSRRDRRRLVPPGQLYPRWKEAVREPGAYLTRYPS